MVVVVRRPSPALPPLLGSLTDPGVWGREFMTISCTTEPIKPGSGWRLEWASGGAWPSVRREGGLVRVVVRRMALCSIRSRGLSVVAVVFSSCCIKLVPGVRCPLISGVILHVCVCSKKMCNFHNDYYFFLIFPPISVTKSV